MYKYLGTDKGGVIKGLLGDDRLEDFGLNYKPSLKIKDARLQKYIRYGPR